MRNIIKLAIVAVLVFCFVALYSVVKTSFTHAADKLNDTLGLNGIQSEFRLD